MGSNVTLRSNVYINKTQRRNDAEFVHHLRDYDTLCKYYDPVYRTSEVPLTKVQYAIMNHGSPKCSLEKGTQSWGIPVGSERFVCRCEELQCPQYSTCSALENFELITRETDSDKQEVPIVLSDSIDHCSPKEEPESANRREEQAIFSHNLTMQIPRIPHKALRVMDVQQSKTQNNAPQSPVDGKMEIPLSFRRPKSSLASSTPRRMRL